MLETDGWQPARLIPTSGINGPDEAERRATSALLAVMGSVKEFGAAILKALGAPAGQLATYIEVPFVLADERSVCPDGLFHVSRGRTSWVSLLEVKTGASELGREQVESYLDVAREQGYDAVLTISNQLAPAAGVHPVEVDRRKLRKVSLHHLSWAEIVTLAVQIRVHRGVSDPDQAWILGELIRYLEHPKSGALDFSDMGASWVAVREAIATGTLRANDRGVSEVASRWDQLLRFSALRLGRELGADVQVMVPRRELADPSVRLARFVSDLVASASLSGTLRIPDAVGPIEVHVDLRASRVTVSVEVDAPQEGRLPTRVGWLTRQLKEAPGQLRVDGLLAGSRSTTSELLSVVRDNPAALIDVSKREFRAFRVAAISPLGTKRGTGRGTFIDSVLAAVDGFYEGVVQGLRPWTAKAPQLPPGGRTATEEAGIDTRPPPTDIDDSPTTDDSVSFDNSEIRQDLLESATHHEHVPVETSNSDEPSVTSHADEFVTWDGAEDRLERERHPIDSSGSPDGASWAEELESLRGGESTH